MHPSHTNPVKREDYEIGPITPMADSSELRRVSAELFGKFQDASFNLIEAEAQRDSIEANIVRRRSELRDKVTTEELAKTKAFRKSVDAQKECVEAQLNPLKKQLAEASVRATAWKQIVFMLRFLGDRIDTISMLAATDKKHTAGSPSVQIEPLQGDSNYDG